MLLPWLDSAHQLYGAEEVGYIEWPLSAGSAGDEFCCVPVLPHRGTCDSHIATLPPIEVHSPVPISLTRALPHLVDDLLPLTPSNALHLQLRPFCVPVPLGKLPSQGGLWPLKSALTLCSTRTLSGQSWLNCSSNS